MNATDISELQELHFISLLSGFRSSEFEAACSPVITAYYLVMAPSFYNSSLGYFSGVHANGHATTSSTVGARR